jgi:hypothetical protein
LSRKTITNGGKSKESGPIKGLAIWGKTRL